MTQRIFDVDNPQDVKDLFELLPSGIQKIRWTANNSVVFLDKDGVIINLFHIAWRDKIEITRPVDESQLVGKLCWFWDNDERPFVAVLEKIMPKLRCKYITIDGESYENCRPVRRDEVQFAEDTESKE